MRLGELLRTHRAHVNLIPLNPTDGFDGLPTHHRAGKAFQAILAEYGIPSTVRQRRGIDIAAGCGQLAATVGTIRGLRIEDVKTFTALFMLMAFSHIQAPSPDIVSATCRVYGALQRQGSQRMARR